MRELLRQHAPAGPALWLVAGRTAGFIATFAVPLVLVRATGAARVSPVGLAREVARLEAGAALERRQTERGFALVATRRGPVGWFPEGALVPVPGYIFRWPSSIPSP